MKRIVCLLLAPFIAAAALADVTADEQAVLASCQADGNDGQRCNCYLQVIKAEVGPDNYAKAIALAVAGARQDPASLVEIRRRLALTEQDVRVLVQSIRIAADRAAEICEPLPVPGEGGGQ